MIRTATAADLSSLAAAMVRLQALHVRALPAIYRPFGVDEALAHLSTLLAQPDAFVRVAVHEGIVAGHAIFRIETRPESMFTHARRYGYVTQLEVESDYRRSGYGRALLAECERLAAAHDVDSIVLDVWAFNYAATAFFRALGYEDFGAKMLKSV